MIFRNPRPMSKVPRPLKADPAISRTFGWLACALWLVTTVTVAEVPAWWQTRGVLQTNATPNDYAALNVGQLKQIAFAAWQELETLPGGAGFQPTFTNVANNYAAVNVGQLKAVATPFYDRLIALGLVTNYPWANSPSTNNYALANIGQAKNLFNFLLDQGGVDSDGDGLSDLAELRYSKIYAWGYNDWVQSTVPASATNVVAVAAGSYHSLALQAGGTVVAWGYEYWGATNVPASVTNAIAVAAGYAHSLALRADGRVVAWGYNADGQTNVPASVTNAIAVAAGCTHSLALRADGRVVAWGSNDYGQTNVPASVTNAIAVAAGYARSLALLRDGTVFTWGYGDFGLTNVPSDAINVIAIAAGAFHSLALRADGRVVAWGGDGYCGETNVPASVTNAIAVAAGDHHSLALLADGTVVEWGMDIGPGAEQVYCADAIAAGNYYGLALCRLDPLNPDMDGDGLPDGWEVRYGLNPFRSNGNSGDSDGDGFFDCTEFCAGTDPAFSVDTVTSSQGRHILTWPEIPGATNYLVTLSYGGSERTFSTNGCSMVIIGDFNATCSVQVSAYDPSLAAVRMASTTFQQPSQSDRKVWKISDPFMFRLDKFPFLIDVQPFFFERTFEICQDTDWPRQFFLSANRDAISGFLSSVGVSKIEVSDDTGCTNSLALGGVSGMALPHHLDVSSSATKVTVRFYVDKEYVRNMGSAVSFDMPIYLIGWRPEIVFDNSVPSYDLQDGTKMLKFMDGPIPFTVKYDGCPQNGISMAGYSAPFGTLLPYDEIPRYDFDQNGQLTGGELPVPDDMGAYTIGGESPPSASASDVLRYILCLLKFEPERVIEPQLRFEDNEVCSVHHDLIGIGKGEFPLDSKCLYEGMMNGHIWDPVIEEEYVDVETSFYYSDYYGSEYLQLTPPSYDWQPGEWSKTVQAKFVYMGTTNIIGSAVVARTGEEEPISGLNLCGDYSWDDEGGCSSCGCGNGSECIEKPELHSVGFRIPLGFTGYKTLSGILWFNVKSNQVVVSPSMFSIMSNSTVQATSAGNTLTVGCPLPGGRKVIVDSITYGVKIRIFNQWADASPARCWTITNDGGNLQKVRFVKYDGADTNSPVGLDELFECNDGVWSRMDNRTKLHESLTETVSNGLTTTTRVMRDGGPLGKILSGTMTVSQIIGTGVVPMARDTLTAEWDGITDSWRQTTMTYWDERSGGSNLIGLPKFRQNPDGSWEYRAYDADGREILRVQARNDSAVPAFVSSIVPAGLNDFANVAGLHASVMVSGYGGAENELPSAKRKPRSIWSYEIQGGTGTILTGCEWHNYTEETINGYAVACHRVERAASQSSPWKGYSGNLVSIDRSYADEPGLANRAPVILAGRPISNLSADGSLTSWEYVLNEAESNLVITTRRGTVAAPNGVAYRTTYDVETLDSRSGQTLKSETRLYTAGGVTPDPELSSVVNIMDSNGRVLKSLYSDGTSISNVWGCCKIDETIGRDGIKSSSSTVTRNGALVTVSAQQWMESLPGTQGRYTVTESSSDALGRETNTTVYVCHNGAADFDYDPQTTLTFYPYGTSNYRISVSPSGMESVSRSYSDGGWEVDETSSAGVTSVVRRASGGGQTVSERIWTDTLTGLPAWTRETTSTSWLADGRKVETIISESSDREGATVTSQTTYDFLGRMVMTTTPLGESSSFYQGARLVRSSRTGMPNTLYFYDSVTGEQRDTVVDVNRNGIVDYAGSDRISRSESCYALLGSDWWRVTTNLVWNQEGSATPLATSVSRERITGLGTPSTEGYGGVLTAQSQSLNWRSAVTTSRTYTDANSSMVWQVTDVPDSSYNDVSLSMGGHVIAANSSIGNTYSFSYDGFGRQITYTDDGRNATSVTHYNSLGQVDFTEDATSNRTCYAYDSLGRKVSQTFLSADGSLSNCTYTAYDVLGQPLAVWGATYPVAYEYDLAGRMTSMYTYRGTNETAFVNAIRQSDINAIRQLSDRTQWLYEPVTGLLTNKLYADGKGPAYTYTTGGRLQTRTWARGVVTAYGYDSLGQLVSVQYSDGTPAVTNTYDRLGRKLSSITAVSTNTFEYTGLELSAETQNSDRIGRSWWPSGQAKCTAINPTPDGTDAESFDDTWINASGQLEYLQKYLHGNYLPWFWYGYQAGREQPSQVYSSWDIDKIIIRETTYEPARDIISAVTATWGAYDYNIENWISWPLTSFNYGNDGLGRRTNRVDVTPTLTVTNAFGYNLKSEVTSATMANGESNYNYDPIGNRVFSSLNALTSIYSANALNQYTAITNSVASVPPCLISPSYDYDGNLTTNGVWSYSWDGENRLKAVYSNDVLVVSNSYDDQSRRIRKVTAGGTRSFLYDGWNVLRESAGSSTNYFLWGTDLSGTLQGAGGVGGLLAVYTVNAGMTSTYYPCYDANGNITAYVDDLGFARAEYAYDAFGNTISQSGDLATTFSHRFSTKYADDETGLYYYGYRYYSSELGRWVNRDPIEESGGANVYGFVGNDGVGVVDSLGLSMVTPPMPFIFNPGLRSREREWILVADSISSLIKHWGINITYDLAGTTPSGTWKGNNIQLSPFFNQQGVVLNPYDQPLQVGVFGYKENYKFVVDNSGKYNDFAHRDAAIVHELIGIVVNKFDGKMSDGYGNFAGSHHASGLQDFSLLAEFGVLAGIRPGYVTHKMLVSRGRDYGGLPLTTKILEDQVSDYAKAIQFVCACEDGKQEGKEYKSTSYERTRNPWSSPSEKIKLQSWLKCQGRKISNGGVSVKLWQFKHKQVEM